MAGVLNQFFTMMELRFGVVIIHPDQEMSGLAQVEDTRPVLLLYKAGSNSGTTWICWECPSSEADPALLRSVLEAGRHIAEKKTGLPDNGPMHAVFHQYHKKVVIHVLPRCEAVQTEK